MLIDQVLLQLCMARKRRLYYRGFDLQAALDQGKPVIFWHTTNGIDYEGFELLPTDSFGSHVPFGTAYSKIERFVDGHKLRDLSDWFFVEDEEGISMAPKAWPHNLVAWLGNGVIDRYHVGVYMDKKKVPECKEKTSST